MKVKFLLLSNSDFFSFIEYCIKKYYDYGELIYFLKFININWITNSKIVFDKNEQSYLVLTRNDLNPKILFYFKNSKSIVSFNFLKEIERKNEEINIYNQMLSNEIKIGEEYFKKN